MGVESEKTLSNLSPSSTGGVQIRQLLKTGAVDKPSLSEVHHLELEAILRHTDAGAELVLIRGLIYSWHYAVVVIFAAEEMLNDLKCFSVDFFVVMTLKEFDFV